MKIMGKMLTTIALALLLYYSGGVAVMHCSCSGATSLYSLADDGCCGDSEGDGGCMTVTLFQLTDQYVAAHADMPRFFPQMAAPVYCGGVLEPTQPSLCRSESESAIPPPGWQAVRGMVMRV